MPQGCANKLHDPVFVVGFNNCGKSTAMRMLQASDDVLLYPGKGNNELWFPDFFPWIDADVCGGAIRIDRERFLREVVASAKGYDPEGSTIAPGGTR